MNQNAIVCPYCNNESKLVGGDIIYPHRPDLYDKKFYLCAPCDAYVGCHKNSAKLAPLGRLANKELRMWKNNAHSLFDPLWRSKEMIRVEAYWWLAEAMGIEIEDCHIGMFDIDQCKQVVQLCKQKRGL